MGLYLSVIAKTTIKETNIHNNSPYINMTPQQPKSLRVYDPDDIPNTTMKEINIHNEHTGFVNNSSNSVLEFFHSSF